jgi:hypothetical protein
MATIMPPRRADHLRSNRPSRGLRHVQRLVQHPPRRLWAASSVERQGVHGLKRDALAGMMLLRRPLQPVCDRLEGSIHPISQAQAFLVLHKGTIAFEQYPGMPPTDNDFWFSCTKTTVSLLVELLMAEGKIDVQKPIDAYVPELKSTTWQGIKVIDLLDIATGLDLEENETTRNDRDTVTTRMNLADANTPCKDGMVEKLSNVLKSAKKIQEPGQVFEYSSAVTRALVLLIEAVENRHWAEVIQSHVWSKMTVERDALIGLSPDRWPAAW